MTIAPELKKKETESEIEYKYRICKNKEIYDLETWAEVSDVINIELDLNFTESAYRKWYKNFENGVQFGIELSEDKDIYEEIKDQKLELQKEKIRFQDQKREYNNIVRQQARFEHLKDEVSKSIDELKTLKPLSSPLPKDPKKASTKKAISLWSDFHVGSTFKNSFNTYNVDIFRERFSELIRKTVQHSQTHEIDELIVANLGDAISGAIHVSTRVQSGEDVIRQIQIVAESFAEGLAELSKYYKQIKFINIIGNHSRLISNKNDSIFRENLEYLIPWFLESRLKDFSNIEILNDTDGIFVEEIDGEKHVFVHGDIDPATSSAKNLPQILGYVPAYIYSAHIHHNYEKEFGKTEVIVNGSLMGVDDYAVSKRYLASPMQKFIVLDGPQIECTYKIKF